MSISNKSLGKPSFVISHTNFEQWVIESKANKKRSHTVIFSFDVADKKLVQQTLIHFFHISQIWPKPSLSQPCRKNWSPLLWRLISLKINILSNLIERFSMFSLSTFLYNGHSQNLFYPKNIRSDVTVNLDLDKRIQRSCFRKWNIKINQH